MITLMHHTNHVNGPNGASLRTHLVEIVDYFFLVRNGHIKSFQFWIRGENLG